ncbi:MAG: WG repeat-containing protein [Paludibacteraceae bacterium]|nr:WG repeat-containing protein [Paludibacteraceae bacterium]
MRKYMLAALLAALLSSGMSVYADYNMGLRVATLRYAEVGAPTDGWLPVFAGGKLGFTDLNGVEKMAPTYDKDRDALEYRFYNNRMKVRKNGKYGYLDKYLDEAIPCEYDMAYDFEGDASLSEHYAIVSKEDRWIFLCDNGKTLGETYYKRVDPFSWGMAAVVGDNDSLGFVNRKGELVIPCKYDAHQKPQFDEYYTCEVTLNGEKIMINSSGEDITSENIIRGVRSDVSRYSMADVKSQWKSLTRRQTYELAATPYDEISFLSDDYLLVMTKKEGKQYGVLRFEGAQSKELIPCGYDNIHGPYNSGSVNYFVVEKSGKYGAYTIQGEMFLPCEYQMIGKEGSQLILVEKNDLFGFVDGQGKEVVACQFNDARPFNAAMTAVEVPKKDKMVWNFIDKTGKVVYTPEYDDAMTFQNGVCPVKRHGAWGVINETGKIIIPFKYEYSFSDDNERWSYAKSKVGDPIPVSKDGKFGYVDLSGKTLLKFIYDEASAFDKKSGVAKVVANDKTFFIDKKGSAAEQMVDEESSMRRTREIEVVNLNGKRGLAKSGEPFATFLDDVKPFATANDYYTPIKIVNKWGLMNGAGEIVVPCIYDAIEVNGNVIIVRVLSKKGLIDAKGNSLLWADEKREQVEWIPLPMDEKQTIDLYYER